MQSNNRTSAPARNPDNPPILVNLIHPFHPVGVAYVPRFPKYKPLTSEIWERESMKNLRWEARLAAGGDSENRAVELWE